MYSPQFILQVQQANDIVELVGQLVSLKNRGKEFIGLCPFHQDHRPSMYVSPVKQIFKCFACGAGGDVFRFVMLSQRLEFPQAVSELAQRAGIALPRGEFESDNADRSLSSQTLVKLMTWAAGYYRQQLASPAGQGALEYARSRQISDESIRRFGLGYAPAGWEDLCRAAVRAGFTNRQLGAAGLAVDRDNGTCYDRFRNRLMFPILDLQDRIIAFGGRALSAEDRAKYLNSPETLLFDKSANLYGLNWARAGIAASKRAVVVEGYLDCLMPVQAGLDNVVATLGTSLTDRHVRLLGRFADEVVLVFDADLAGQLAAQRAIELFLAQRVNLRVATVPTVGPAGEAVKDPCDYVLAAGGEAFKKALDEAPDALEYAWSRQRAAYQKATSIAEKGRIADDFLRLVVSSAAYGAIDTLRQNLLANHIGELVGLSPTQVAGQMQRLARSVRRPGSAQPAPQPETDVQACPSERAEKWLLGALLNQPELFPSICDRLEADDFRSPLLRPMAQHVWSLGVQGQLSLAAVLAADPGVEWAQAITDLQLSGQERGLHEQTALEACQDLLRRRRQDEMQAMKLQGNDDQALKQIQEEGRRPDRRRLPRLR